MLNRPYLYSRWDGSQNIFGADAEEVMDHLSNELMAHGDLMRALREMMRRGMQDGDGQQMPGLRDLMQQLREQRQQQLEQYNMDSVIEDIEKRLEEVLTQERQGINRRLEEAQEQIRHAEGAEKTEMEALNRVLEQRALRNLEKLDALPESTGGAIRELLDYDFIDPEAQRLFQELLDMLRGQAAQNISQDMVNNLQNMSPEQMSALQEMFRELNQMLQERAQGGQPDFQGFMDRFGEAFGPNPPQSLDELLEQMMHQMSQMQSMLESMSPEARREMEEALSAAMDPGLARELAQLASWMEQLMPMDNLRRQYPFLGDDSLSMDQAMELMKHLQESDDMARSLQEAIRTGDLENVDPDKLAELLGEEARRTWEQLNELLEALREGGYITEGDDPTLTPRAIRRIGQKALREVFLSLQKDRLGDHELTSRGDAGDNLTDTKPYEFGDPFQLELQATVKNAVLRAGPGTPVGLSKKDLEVYQSESQTRAATVVLLDQSRSMGLCDSFYAAKKVAMALYALIHMQYPRDSLYVIGFSDYAREIKEEELPKVAWNTWAPGTNLHHALMLSRKLLSREKGCTKQVLLITDGEPTAHLEGDRSFFNYPPAYQTIMETMKEARRCTQESIVINTFMLESSYQLVNFVDQLTRINQGRAFYSSPDRLGEYVLVDYVNNRRKRVNG
ncbi:MAG: VWA domain-containing protein [Dehalococcoidia bacterium]|nr:VWA domain-containing protein [Dehalococcoidia bacterium]